MQNPIDSRLCNSHTAKFMEHKPMAAKAYMHGIPILLKDGQWVWAYNLQPVEQPARSIEAMDAAVKHGQQAKPPRVMQKG